MAPLGWLPRASDELLALSQNLLEEALPYAFPIPPLALAAKKTWPRAHIITSPLVPLRAPDVRSASAAPAACLSLCLCIKS